MATGSKNKGGATVAKDDVADVSVRMLHPVRHDGKDYGEGEMLELPRADAADLVAGGYAESARNDPDELSLA